MSSPSEKLCGPQGILHAEPADAEEIAALLRSGLARLQDSGKASLALQSRFDLAYGAAHALSLAALRRAGYRARQRYVVFQRLPYTTSLGPEVWRVLDEAHRLRNLAEYEGDLRITDGFVIDLIAATRKVADAISA